MNGLAICAACKGKGKYTVRNAYDPTYQEEVICEHCDGDGVIATFQHDTGGRRRRSDDDKD